MDSKHRAFGGGVALVMPKPGGRLKDHPLYGTWSAMKSRCYNHKNEKYHLYGGRGIKVCHQWQENLYQFAADVGHRPDGMTLDRIDTDGHYEPGNTRWATDSEQNRNRRNTVWVDYCGESILLLELANAVGLDYFTLHQRIIRRGWSVERAVATPILPKGWIQL
jgi:hypothetical protein